MGQQIIKTTWRELDARETDNGTLRIALHWHPETGRCMVTTADRRTGETTSEIIDGRHATSRYNHACAYLP